MEPISDLIVDGAPEDKVGFSLSLRYGAKIAHSFLSGQVVISMAMKSVWSNSKRSQGNVEGMAPTSTQVRGKNNNTIVGHQKVLQVEGHSEGVNHHEGWSKSWKCTTYKCQVWRVHSSLFKKGGYGWENPRRTGMVEDDRCQSWLSSVR